MYLNLYDLWGHLCAREWNNYHTLWTNDSNLMVICILEVGIKLLNNFRQPNSISFILEVGIKLLNNFR